MNQFFKFRHKKIELEYHGWPFLYKPGKLFPLKLSYNITAGWWISSKLFLSTNQLKKIIQEMNKLG